MVNQRKKTLFFTLKIFNIHINKNKLKNNRFFFQKLIAFNSTTLLQLIVLDSATDNLNNKKFQLFLFQLKSYVPSLHSSESNYYIYYLYNQQRLL